MGHGWRAGGMTAYVVAGAKPWSRRIFDEVISKFPGRWIFVASREELTPDYIREIEPRYIFFLHWSWVVPREILDAAECVCFHMSDVPYGRGGSPLQNLISRGHRQTKLSALRMVETLDAGPVYAKADLSLEGNAEEIYLRATNLSATMIREMIEHEPRPVEQSGTPVVFQRRKPAESRIPESVTLTELHDFIRMLDAEGYPRAFLEHEGLRLEFARAALYDGRIVADVTITKLGTR
jgi:methionyl-tRNA formyltransferase